MRGGLRITFLFATFLLLNTLAWAQWIPTRTVRLVEPFSAGSGPDIVARALAEHLAKIWGQAVVVETRGGANGKIAVGTVKDAEPDGHTLIVLDSSAVTINPYLYRSVDWDAERDLTPISLWFNNTFYLATSSHSKFRSVADVIAFAKKNPGKLAYGTPTGLGHPAHLGMEQLKLQTGTDIVLVPYRGSQAMLTDLMTDRLELGWTSYASALPSLQSGKLKLLASGSATRQPGTPDVPTIGESGGPPGLVVNAWVGLFGPRGMPSSVVSTISEDISRVMRQPEVLGRIAALHSEPLVGDRNTMLELMRSDSRRHRELIKRLNLTID